jgi:muramoyltetrapeptide carboxypeptidase
MKSQKAFKTSSASSTLPPSLHRGDSVALIRPASKLDEELFQKAVQNFRSLGYFVVLYPGTKRKHDFFSASDETRAREISWAFSQPGIKAIFCCRGGYGSMRLPQYWTPQELKRWKPKILLGYSDVTFLHQWIHNRFGWVGFHAPLVGQISSADIKDLLTNVQKLGTRKAETWSECRLIRNGSAKGILYGGNLSLIQTHGAAELPRRKMILALEDVNEAHYRIDRMLWSLIHSGYSDWVEGIILGQFFQCGKNEKTVFEWQWVLETLKKLCPHGPILSGAAFGHGLKRQRILPLGAELQVEGRRLRWPKPLVQD